MCTDAGDLGYLDSMNQLHITGLNNRRNISAHKVAASSCFQSKYYSLIPRLSKSYPKVA